MIEDVILRILIRHLIKLVGACGLRLVIIYNQVSVILRKDRKLRIACVADSLSNGSIGFNYRQDLKNKIRDCAYFIMVPIALTILNWRFIIKLVADGELSQSNFVILALTIFTIVFSICTTSLAILGSIFQWHLNSELRQNH